MKIYRSRHRKENHICITVEGKDANEIGMKIRAVLKRIKHRRSTSYEVKILDFPQSVPRAHNQ